LALANNPLGARASANLFSLVSSARANGVRAYAYLNYIFENLPAADTVEAFEALLPWNVKSVLQVHGRAGRLIALICWPQQLSRDHAINDRFVGRLSSIAPIAAFAYAFLWPRCLARVGLFITLGTVLGIIIAVGAVIWAAMPLVGIGISRAALANAPIPYGQYWATLLIEHLSK